MLFEAVFHGKNPRHIRSLLREENHYFADSQQAGGTCRERDGRDMHPQTKVANIYLTLPSQPLSFSLFLLLSLVFQTCFVSPHLQFCLSSSSSTGCEFRRGPLFVYFPSALFSVLNTMPVPFYTAADHLGKVAGGERKNRAMWRAESRDEREGEREWDGQREMWIMKVARDLQKVHTSQRKGVALCSCPAFHIQTTHRDAYVFTSYCPVTAHTQNRNRTFSHTYCVLYTPSPGFSRYFWESMQ